MIATYRIDPYLVALFGSATTSYKFIPVGVRDQRVIALCRDANALQATATTFGIDMIAEVVDEDTFSQYEAELATFLKRNEVDKVVVPTKDSLARVPWDDVREMIVLPLYEHNGRLFCLYHRYDDESARELSARFKASVSIIKARPEAITKALARIPQPNDKTAPALAYEQIFKDALRRGVSLHADDVVFDHRGAQGGEIIAHTDLQPHVLRTLSEDDLRGVIRAALSDAKIPSSELTKPHTGHIVLPLANRTEYCRLIYLPTHGSLGTLSIRFAAREDRFPTLDSLGMPRAMSERLLRLALGEPGLIISTGQPSSGKTTLVYALQHARAQAQHSRSARSFEAPVESRRPWLAQTSVGELGGGLTLSDLAPYLLGVPTDSVFLGQVLTPEDALALVRLAYSNIPTFTTFHASSAPHACWRLFTFGVSPADLAQIVRVILHQRRIKRLCSCKIPAEALTPRPSLAIATWTEHIATLDSTYFAPHRQDATMYEPRPDGCTRCNNTGYFGTIVAYEFLEASRAVREAIERRASTTELMRVEPSYAPVWVDVARLLLAGEIGVTDALVTATPSGAWRGAA